MSKTGMWATIVLIVLLALGAWWYVSNTSVPVQDAAPAVAETPPPTPEPDTAGISNDSSDAGLDGDLKMIDAHVEESASVGASASAFTDTPIPQTE